MKCKVKGTFYLGPFTLNGYSGGCQIWTGYEMHRSIEWRPINQICLN